MGLMLFSLARLAAVWPASTAEKTNVSDIGLRLRIITLTLHLFLCPIGHFGCFDDGDGVSGSRAGLLLSNPGYFAHNLTIADSVSLECCAPRFSGSRR